MDRFIESLLEAGFEPTGDQRSWVGPVHPALGPLTDASTMKVVVRDGWPFMQPRVYVGGLPIGRHRNSAGDVCLWEVGDPSLEWKTWDGVARRVEKWAAEAQGDPTAEDPGLDPHLVFTGWSMGLATIDLTGRDLRDGSVDKLRAKRTEWALEIGEGEEIGRWYVRDRLGNPPQTLADLAAQLDDDQRMDLDRELVSVGSPDGVSFLVLAWSTPVGPNLLVLGLERGADGTVTARPYEAARTDSDVLRLRAGPDAAALAEKSAVIFGVGAIGSHVAELLARSGLRQLVIFDRQYLRPGDVVRHAAGGITVGRKKVHAVWLSIAFNAPWTKVVRFDEDVWAPSTLGLAAEAADVVIDAVGTASFTAQLSRVCHQKERPLVSVALYRRGAVGRVRLQSADSESEIAHRLDDPRFPVIPTGPEEIDVAWEAGCASPIAQAPPTSVVGIAASAARLVVDLLTKRQTDELDLVETYRPLDEPPFDSVGSQRYLAS